MKKEKLYEDSELGTVRVVKSRRARRVSLRVHPVRGIVVTVPLPSSLSTATLPPRPRIFETTTSMPTPRPPSVFMGKVTTTIGAGIRLSSRRAAPFSCCSRPGCAPVS